jgi:hypothetical protein
VLSHGSFHCPAFLVYSNSFLATLNARSGISDSVDNVDHMMVSIPRSAMSSTQVSKSQQQNISIRIDTTQESLHDAAMRKVINQSIVYRDNCLPAFSQAHTARMRSGMLDSVSDMKESDDDLTGDRRF